MKRSGLLQSRPKSTLQTKKKYNGVDLLGCLLSNTNIKPKINKAEIETKFEANIGTPQGPKVIVSVQFFSPYISRGH